MLIYFQDYLDKLVDKRTKEKTKTPITLKLDVVGFSRGAASARMFASKLEWLINQDYSKTREASLPFLDPIYQSESDSTQTMKWKYGLNNLCGINIQFNYLGLWDTVPAYGFGGLDDDTQLSKDHYSLQISKKWNKVAQAVALNEHRSGFPVRSIFNNQAEANTKNGTNRIERGFLGAHSDIGGGYAEGNLSNASLMWIINEGRKAGVKFNENKITSNNYRTVQIPMVHDSVGSIAKIEQFRPSRDFMWAKDDAKGISQFANIPHLGLTWEGTKTFENPRAGNKFSEMKKLSERYVAPCKTKFCSQARASIHNQYMALKASNNNTLLYNSSNPNERIQIDKYLKWLNDHYGLNLKSK